MIQQEGHNIFLVDKDKKLAKMTVHEFGEGSIRLSNWKALVKGHGYGKELIREYIKSHHKVWSIATDGFTQVGAKQIELALPNFKMIEWRRGVTAGIGLLMRQDAVDYYIELRARGGRSMFLIHPSLHSKHSKIKLRRKDGIVQHYHKRLSTYENPQA